MAVTEKLFVQLITQVLTIRKSVQTPFAPTHAKVSPTHCKLIARSTPAPLPVLLPNSILPLRSSNCTCIPSRKKRGAPFRSFLFHFFIFF